MPGGPQPVVAPPEPNPALPGAGYNAVTDPVLKQQQQLIALQQAAAGFSNGQLSSSQMRSDSLLPMVDPMQGAGQGFAGMLDAGGSMDMGALQRQLSNVSGYASGLPTSAPLSAPLPQLSPDLLAALNMSQNMSPAPQLTQATLGPNGLLHHHSGIPSGYHSSQLPGLSGGRPLQRSFTSLQENTDPAVMGELAKQLAVMQLMQQNGAANASTPLPQMVNNGLDDSLMGQLAQLQQKQQQQMAASAGLDLQSLLANPAASAAMLHQDSFSCPLPPVYSTPTLTSLAPVSAAMPRVPSDSAAADSAILQHQLQLGGLTGGSASPTGSGGAALASTRRDTQDVDGPDSKAGAQQPWSAPVSPCTSSKNGNDQAAADIRMSSISFTTGGRSSPSPSSNSNTTGSPSSATPSDNISNGELRELSQLSGGLPGFEGIGVSTAQIQEAPLLMIGDTPLQPAQLQQVLAGDHSAVPGGMGKEKAAQLLGQLPESAVLKLLQLVAQQQ